MLLCLGDPEDRSLRKIEADVVVPNLMNREIEKTECRLEYEELVKCLRREGGAMGLRLCKSVLGVFNECKLRK
jgi:COX assembly protein 1